MALMILAFPAAIYGAFPWGIALGAFLFLLGVVVAASRFSAIVWSWCLFSLGMYLAAPFIWMWNPDYFFSRSFDILLISGCLVGSLVLLAIRFAVIPVLWPRIFRHFVEGSPTLEDLAPEKGKTVAELRGGIERRQVNFLFGHADRELVEKWGKIAQGIAALSRSRKRLAIWAAGIFLAWPAAVFFLSGGMGGAPHVGNPPVPGRHGGFQPCGDECGAARFQGCPGAAWPDDGAGARVAEDGPQECGIQIGQAPL